MDQSFKVQLDIKRNAEDLQRYALDLKNWEEEMKLKERDLLSSPAGEQDFPPPRNKIMRSNSKEEEEKEKPKRISAYDYTSWDKFDVEKACEDVDDKKSNTDGEADIKSEARSMITIPAEMKQDMKLKNIDEAFYEKELGNQFVRKSQWKEAIQCYTRAINLDPQNSIYYANRALCFIKLSNFKSAEVDGTVAIQLDEHYVKAYQRRGFARTALGQLAEAKCDYEMVLQHEPDNKLAKAELVKIDNKLANDEVALKKLAKSESSFDPKKIFETKSVKSQKALIKKDKETSEKTEIEVGKAATGKQSEGIPVREKTGPVLGTQLKLQEIQVQDEVMLSKAHSPFPCIPANSCIIEPVKKPPHMRSKVPLQRVNIIEVRKESDIAKVVPRADINSIDLTPISNSTKPIIAAQSAVAVSVEPHNEHITTSNADPLQVPKHCVQFRNTWKTIKHTKHLCNAFLKLIPPHDLSKIFGDSLESDIFSDVIATLSDELSCRDPDLVSSFLIGLSKVKRFGSVLLFMSDSDRKGVKKCLEVVAESGKPEHVEHLKRVYEM